jgi:amino acid transporter
MGFNATWSMAVGGMIGGGIFSVLGVVIALAGAWAWVSLTLAGLIALATGHSYIQLAARFGEGGGAFTFLREEKLRNAAGALSWVLVIGYVLTISVYAFTFAHYVGDVAGLAAWWTRPLAGGVVALLLVVNLRGVGQASWLEIVTVWGKLVVLVGLAAIGLWLFDPQAVRYADAAPGGWNGVLVAAASIFMAYEGFQLLTYDYDDIRDPKRTLRRAVLSAIVTVIVIYAVVALGAASLATAGAIVEHEEVALAVAGEAALGPVGKILVSIAAAFSTASAINATLFATARLSVKVAGDGELPAWFCHRNGAGAPDRAVIVLGAGGAVLAMIGGLSDLVEAASLAFLVTFATVNVLAALHIREQRWVGVAGAIGASAAAIGLCIRLAMTRPVSLLVMVLLVLVAIVGRPILLRHLGRGR